MATHESGSVTVETDGFSPPEQIASDLLRCAFIAVSAIQARDEEEQVLLARLQNEIAEGVRAIGFRWSVV